MTNEFKAEIVTRSWVPLKILIMGTSGSGKTYGALKLAEGITGDYSKVSLIDTENGRGALKSYLGKYHYVKLNPPFTIDRYVRAIQAQIDDGLLPVVDSFSHAWAGQGGLMEKKDEMDERNRKETFSNWLPINNMEAKLKAAILNSPTDIIVTVRSKMEYVLEDKKVTKRGLSPVQRPGIEYDFSFIFDVDDKHIATVRKDDSNIWGVGTEIQLSEEHGVILRKWRDEVEPELPKACIPEPVQETAARVTKTQDVYISELRVKCGLLDETKWQEFKATLTPNKEGKISKSQVIKTLEEKLNDLPIT